MCAIGFSGSNGEAFYCNYDLEELEKLTGKEEAYVGRSSLWEVLAAKFLGKQEEIYFSVVS